MAAQGLQGQINNTRAQATAQDTTNYSSLKDWRVILRLAPGSNYLYNAPNPGIMQPLNDTQGVIFPYTPQIAVQYSASYDSTDITHSNYKVFQYKNSAVDSVTVTCEFTAQDTSEANYLLAVIHFFRTATKMFYGQDESPVNGTPPPLCYITGLGEYQFNNHPLAITGFTYSLPNDVDYIRAAGSSILQAGAKNSSFASQSTSSPSAIRTASSGVVAGGLPPPTTWNTYGGDSDTPTYVPTKIQLQITAIPIISRLDVSQTFSVRDYATGELLLGSKRNGGIW